MSQAQNQVVNGTFIRRLNTEKFLSRINHSPIIPLVWFAAIAIIMYSQMGDPILILLVPFAILYVAWAVWGRKHPITATVTFERLFLLMFGWQFFHLIEEFSTGFYAAFPAFWGQFFHGNPAHYAAWSIVVFINGNLIMDFFWTMAYMLMPKKTAWANYAFNTLLVGMALNGVQHPFYSWYLWTHQNLQAYLHTVLGLNYTWYFPGLFTSFGHLALSILMIRYLIRARQSGDVPQPTLPQ